MRRKTSSLERYMLFFGRQYPLNFGFRLELDSPLDRVKAESALKRLSRRHPVLFAHQEYTVGKKMDMVFPAEPMAAVTENSSRAPWQNLLLSLMTAEINPFTGPLFTCNFRNTGGASELFFVFQHGAVDGIAAVYFIHDFLRLYRDLSVETPVEINMPVLYDVLKEDILAELLTRPEPDWKKEDPPPPKPFDMPAYKAPDFFLRTFEMTEDATSALASKAKEEGQTVHSWLGAEILKASSDIFSPESGATRTIQCPVDFRQYLKEEFRAVAGVYNGIVKVPVDCSGTLAAAAGAIKDGIRANREGYRDIEEYFHFRDSFDNVEDPESLMMGFTQDPLDYDFSFSNLGKTVIDRDYAGLKVSGFFGPIFTAVNGETVIGLNTTGGQLRMSLIFDSGIEKAALYRRLGDRIGEILASY